MEGEKANCEIVGDLPRSDVDVEHELMNWADEVERLTISEPSPPPSAPVDQTGDGQGAGWPRKPYQPTVDVSKVPLDPPFIAIVFNIPLDVTETDVADFFSVGVEKINFVRHGNNRFQGTSYVEFIDRQTLINALHMTGKTLNTRTIRVELSKTMSRGRPTTGSHAYRGGRPFRDASSRRQPPSTVYGGRRFSETTFPAAGNNGFQHRTVASNDVRNAPEYQMRRCSVDVPREGRLNSLPRGVGPYVPSVFSSSSSSSSNANQVGMCATGGRSNSRQIPANSYAEAQMYSATEDKSIPYEHSQMGRQRDMRMASMLYLRVNQGPPAPHDSYRGGRMLRTGMMAHGSDDRRRDYHYATTLPRMVNHPRSSDYDETPEYANFAGSAQRHQRWPNVDEPSTARRHAAESAKRLPEGVVDVPKGDSNEGKSFSKIFGEAKPVDTDKRLREIERQRLAAAATRCAAQRANSDSRTVASDDANLFTDGHVKLLKRPPQPAVVEQPTAVEPEALARMIEKQKEAAAGQAEHRSNFRQRGYAKRGRRDRATGRRGQLDCARQRSARHHDQAEGRSPTKGDANDGDQLAKVSESRRPPVEGERLDRPKVGAAAAALTDSEQWQSSNEKAADDLRHCTRHQRHEFDGSVDRGRRPSRHHHVRHVWRGGNRSLSNPRPNGSAEQRIASSDQLAAMTRGGDQQASASIAKEADDGSATAPPPPPTNCETSSAAPKKVAAKGRDAGRKSGRGGSHHRRHPRSSGGRQAFTDRNKYDLLNSVDHE